ncbi:F-box/WD-40 repeat-containing protein [Sesamum angolense]|uniref:F-box/WD-40 repeat-containing protein n=1 Tax=Sesamum angolense TaxID=2727404 RepID=A0AAE1X927_9LAMI|nr:F-box/WD-40 repeat-containing protein [Sesamum angolense]
MAFECHQDTEIGVKDTLSNCLDNPQTQKPDSDQVVLINNRKAESLGTENLQTVISEILNFLDPKGLGIVSCVNTFLYGLASEHHVWQEFYYERWGHPVTAVNLGPGYSDEKSWKELFVEREFRSKTYLGRYTIETLYGHTEAVRTVFVLVSRKLLFTSGYDQVVRMWDMEEGLSIASSRPLGCTIRAVAADTRLLIAGVLMVSYMVGRSLCIMIGFGALYLMILQLGVQQVQVYIWDTDSGTQLAVTNSAHVGNTYALARSHTGKLLFTGGENGSIHMFEITRNVKCNMRRIATWIPHTGPVYSLAFEFPWLVSASSDGKISLIDVRKLLKTSRHSSTQNTFKVAIGFDRIVCGGEEGVIRIWNFSQALEIEQRVRSLRGIRLENRMRRRKLQTEMSAKGSQGGQCSVAAKKNQMNSDKNSWHNKRRVNGKLKA